MAGTRRAKGAAPRGAGDPRAGDAPGAGTADSPEVREAREAARARSARLMLRLELVGCEYAAEIGDEAAALPEQRFVHPCPFGKARSDLECLDCAHVTVRPLGAALHLERSPHRYHARGAVWPVADEAAADALADFMARRGADPLARPVRQAHHAARLADLDALRARQAAAAEAERAQSPFGTVPIRRDAPPQA